MSLKSKDEAKVSRDVLNRKKIAEANKKHLLDDAESILADVEKNNFIELWTAKGIKKRCNCGGNLEFSAKNEVYFHAGEDIAFVTVAGKRCADCKCIYIVKDILLKTIKGIT